MNLYIFTASAIKSGSDERTQNIGLVFAESIADAATKAKDRARFDTRSWWSDRRVSVQPVPADLLAKICFDDKSNEDLIV